jgi:oligopeptide transport system permease protein
VLSFIINRLLQAIPTIWVIITITFFLIMNAPGDPFSAEREIREETKQQLKEYYGLDKPQIVQYALYLKRLATFDLGPSYKQEGRTINEIIAESFPVSLELGLLAMTVSLLIGVPAGVLAASRKNTSLDYVPMSAAMIGICMPTFVIGPILGLVCGVGLGWFNVAGWFSFQDRILPATTLGLAYAAYIARLTRAGMLETLNLDYIRTARAKGLREHTVVLRHALRGGIMPVVSFLGPAMAGMISGSFVVETIFQVPGLGRYFIDGALNRDYSMILGTTIFYATLVILANLLVDVCHTLLDPKLRKA